MAPASGRTMGSAANGTCKNYHVTDVHMHITTLFLKSLYKNGKFSLILLWIAKELLVYQITGSLLYLEIAGHNCFL
jgi:hypothetical protein